jgi:metal-dependent hydrolase (beta-lactamase superfamily II)
MSIEIKVLASSSKGNATIISDGATTILLDCGIPVAQIKRHLNFNLSSVVGCLVSHEHL